MNTRKIFRHALLLGCLMAALPGVTTPQEEKLVVVEGLQKANGTALFCKTIGSGEPIVVLHGGPGMDHEYFLPQMEPLARRFKLIFYDQRHTGRSEGDPDPDTITVKTFVEDLEQLRQAWGLEKLTLLGHSWGGLLAMHYAIVHPDRVKGLILVGTAPGTSEFWGTFGKNIHSRLSPEDTQTLNKLDSTGDRDPEILEKRAKIVFKAYFDDPATIRELTTKIMPQTARNGHTVRGLLHKHDIRNYDIHEKLEALTCPTLIIHGKTDPLPYAYSERLSKHIKGSKLVLMEKCGHYPYIERPEDFRKAVGEFVGK